MKIVNESRDFDKVDKYLMTAGKGAVSMKDVEDGTSIPVAGYLEFVDEKDDGTESEFLPSSQKVEGKYTARKARLSSAH